MAFFKKIVDFGSMLGSKIQDAGKYIAQKVSGAHPLINTIRGVVHGVNEFAQGPIGTAIATAFGPEGLAVRQGIKTVSSTLDKGDQVVKDIGTVADAIGRGDVGGAVRGTVQGIERLAR